MNHPIDTKKNSLHRTFKETTTARIVSLKRCIFCTLSGIILWLVMIIESNAQSLDPQTYPNTNPSLITAPSLDKVVATALETFYTPGASVAIVHQGQIVHAKGYGFRDLKKKTPVTKDTYFRLASTSKAFTAATMAILVDEGKVQWDDKVIDFLPNFALSDPATTSAFTILDLFTHRSGLVGGAGDSMLWPEPTGFTRAEIIHNLRYLTPEYRFRSTYGYSNVMYITAAEVVAKIANQPWEQFLHERIFAPLQMDCYASSPPDTALNNAAMGYGHNDERGIYPIPRNAINNQSIVSAPAGGIICNASSMAIWLQTLLNEAHTPSGAALISREQLNQIFTPQMPLFISEHDKQTHRTHSKSYAIGWRIQNIYGYEMISHTGTLSGYQAYAAIIPELELGVIILNNGSNYGVRDSVMQTIIKSVMPEAKPVDWIDHYIDYQAKQEQRYLRRLLPEPKGSGTVLLPLSSYLGTFCDEWFGEVNLYQDQNNIYRFSSAKMPTLRGRLEAFDQHSWIVRWDNQNAASDAFVHFEVNPDNTIKGFSMYPYTAKEIINHEYRDMFFVPQPALHDN